MDFILCPVLVTLGRATAWCGKRMYLDKPIQREDLRAERDNRKWGREFHHALWVRWVS